MTAPVGDVEMWSRERILREVEDGDAHGWREEAIWLWKNRSVELIKLMSEIAVAGILEPIDIAWTGTKWRMWDGHHRVVVAGALCIEAIPVRFHTEDEDPQ